MTKERKKSTRFLHHLSWKSKKKLIHYHFCGFFFSFVYLSSLMKKALLYILCRFCLSFMCLWKRCALYDEIFPWNTKQRWFGINERWRLTCSLYHWFYILCCEPWEAGHLEDAESHFFKDCINEQCHQPKLDRAVYIWISVCMNVYKRIVTSPTSLKHVVRLTSYRLLFLLSNIIFFSHLFSFPFFSSSSFPKCLNNFFSFHNVCKQFFAAAAAGSFFILYLYISFFFTFLLFLWRNDGWVRRTVNKYN